MARHNFDDPASHASQADTGPRRLTYQCRAHGCPMPGTVDETCGWHYRESPQDWGRITDAIERWSCVARAINHIRTVLCRPDTCCDGKAHKAAMAEALADISADITSVGWKRRVEPKPGEDIGSWCRRLEVFLGARIKSDMTGHEVDETQPTPTVAAMRAALRGSISKGNAGDWL